MKFRRTIAPFLLSLSMSFCSPSPSGTISELVNPAEQTSPVRAESRKDFDNFDYTDFHLNRKTIEMLLSSSVRILNDDGFGSGTLLEDHQTGDNYVLTALHNLRSSSLAVEVCPEVYDLLPEIFKIDADSDLALLKLNGGYGSAFPGKIASLLLPGYLGAGVGFTVFERRTLFFGRVAGEKEVGISHQIVGGDINQGYSGGGFYIFQKGVPFYAGEINFRYEDNAKELRGLGGIIEAGTIRAFLTDTPLADDYL
ncbi:hypothetical protein J4210_05625 [Candidatus Woesearchaeota archaeon]|nr:hypothetical protein [Candidatus Woesearchaeota archaeon]